ncbi:MAG: hypothetical protein WCO71_02260 [Pseudomonadota bacterium]
MRPTITHMISIIILVATTASSLLADTRGNQADDIVITKYVGDVFWRRPFSSRWLKIKKSIAIPTNSLVRVGNHSGVTLLVPPSQTAAEHDRRNWSLLINEPTIFLASPDILRQMTIDKVELSAKLKDFKPESAPAKEVKKTSLRKFKDAWRILIPDFPPGSERIGGVDDELPYFADANLGAKPRTIELLYPKDKGLLYDPAPRLTFSPIWKPASDPGQKYYVRLWRKGETTAPVVAVSNENQVSLNIDQSGLYYLRIETSDGLWISRIQRFEVYVGKGVSDLTDSSPKTDQSQLNPLNVAADTLACLPDNAPSYVQSFIFPTETAKPGQARLVWQRLQAGFPESAPDVLDDHQTKIKSTLLNEKQPWIQFKPGRYFWQLASDSPAPFGGQLRRSRVYQLEVTRSCPDVSVLLSGKSGRRVVYGVKS